MKKEFLPVILTAISFGVIGFLAGSYFSDQNTESGNELKTYSSKELGIEFDYPSNLSLNFTPIQSEDGNSREVEAIGIDQLLFLRTKRNFEIYSKQLESSVIEEATTDYELDKFEIDGKQIKFVKYIYGDGQPSAGCMWGDMWINYVAELDSDIVAEIKVNEQITCDSENEYLYKTDPKRIEQALKLLKTIRNL